ncbi:MAG: hypothetical protein JW817_05360 [Clostridiales bacterium]|nr:hypothetical protein [Clostridiales bacterium]
MIKSTYRSSLWLILLKSLPLFIMAEAFLFSVNRSAVSGTLRIAAIPVGLVVAPGLLVLYILYNRITIQITDEEVRFSRIGRNYMIFPVSSRSYTSYIRTETLQNFIRFTVRYLRATDKNGKVEDHRCYGFTKEAHERLVSELQAISERISGLPRIDLPPENEDEPQRSDLPFGGAQFIFPRDLFSKILLKGFARKSIGIALIFLTLGAAGFAPTLMQGGVTEKDLPAIFAGIGIVLLPITVTMLCLWLSYKGRIKKIPETIRVTDSVLRFDEQAYRRDEIIEIRMTPEHCHIENDTLHRFRKIKIRTVNDQRIYLLGHIDGRKNCFCYQEYGDLYKSINAFLRPTGKNVIMITF